MSSAFIPVFRRGFLFLSGQPRLRRWTETSSVARRLTKRFVAGTESSDAMHVKRELEASGAFVSLDRLGENVKSLAEASAATEASLEALAQVAAASRPGTISIKLTALGLDIDEVACRGNVEILVRRAAELKTRVEFDMEGSDYTERTIEIVKLMHARFGAVRAVIQAYLHRSASDVGDLSSAGVPVRLCKGAYREPPTIAFPRKRQVDENYVLLMKQLLDAGTYPAIASHDENIIREAIRYVREKRIAADQFEFQMLYGVRRDLQREVLQQNFRLRVYVPYGSAWYPYFMRRLAERPANVLFLLKSLWTG